MLVIINAHDIIVDKNCEGKDDRKGSTGTRLQRSVKKHRR